MTELYIGGKLVDIDSDTKITLLYSSPFFVDIDKLLENRSYTISLPLTQNNQRVIELANKIDVKTTFPYRTYDALMIVDSVPIIEGGRAYLLTISDRIEIALTWGLSVGNLRDAMLSDYYDLEYLPAINEAAFATEIAPYFYPKLNYGNEIKPLFPACSVLDILNRLNIDYLDVESYLKNFILCTTTRNAGLVNKEESKLDAVYNNNVYYASYERLSYMFDPIVLDTPFFYGEEPVLIPKIDGVLYAKGSFNIEGTGINPNAYLEMRVYKNMTSLGDNPDITENLGIYTAGLVTNKVSVVVDLQIEVTAGDKIYFTGLGLGTPNIISSRSDIEFFIAPKDGVQITYSMRYPIKENMPDIKAVDFLAAICTMIGASIVQDGAKLKMQRLNDILDKENYVDWSNKLISYSDLSFKFLDLAQRNYIEYQEESSRAYIEVSNSTLELTKTLADLPFLAVDDVGGVGYIPAYEYDEDKSEYEYSGALDPVILNYFVDGEGYISGRFEGLEATDIISDHYSTYKELVYQPKVITANIKLSIVDQLNLDFTRPIWMAQFGCFFALVEASISDGIGKCTLVRDTTISAYKFEDYLLSEDGQELTTESGEYLKY